MQSMATDSVLSETTHPDRSVLRLDEACKQARISSRTMRRLRDAGKGPRVIRISDRCLGIRRCDLDAWIESRAAAM